MEQTHLTPLFFCTQLLINVVIHFTLQFNTVSWNYIIDAI